jgi:CelD/BcsL family acetyltransferase involved in cellulose biosynthesis
VDGADETEDALSLFLTLFKASRPDKAVFMTEPMTAFFNALTRAFSPHRILKIGVLEMDGVPVSAVMCFDYQQTRYLYNSGYDPLYRPLSAGLICKVFSIRDAVEKGMRRFDLLKGAEPYKARLGGTPTDILRCTVTLPD